MIGFLILHSNLALSNCPLLSFGIVSKKNIHNYLKRLLKYFPFSSTYLHEADFSSFTSMKTMYHNRLHKEADIRIQVSYVRYTLKRFAKISPCSFCFGQGSYFHTKKVLFMLACNGFIGILISLIEICKLLVLSNVVTLIGITHLRAPQVAQQ